MLSPESKEKLDVQKAVKILHVWQSGLPFFTSQIILIAEKKIRIIW